MHEAGAPCRSEKKPRRKGRGCEGFGLVEGQFRIPTPARRAVLMTRQSERLRRIVKDMRKTVNSVAGECKPDISRCHCEEPKATRQSILNSGWIASSAHWPSRNDNQGSPD
jgi:hypothetical protein